MRRAPARDAPLRIGSLALAALAAPPRRRTRSATSPSTTSPRCRSRRDRRRRALHPRPGRDPDLPGARAVAPRAVLARKRDEVVARARADGRRARRCRSRRRGPGALAFPAGPGRPADDARRVRPARRACARRGASCCATTPSPGASAGRRSSRRPGTGTAVRSTVAGDDPTHGLRATRARCSSTPARRARRRRFAVAPGARHGDGAGRPPATRPRRDRSGGTAASRALLERRTPRAGVLVLLLLAAFGWGALHALSPGHGKTMVAAYLVGTRGTAARTRSTLGATVTVTHTIGVFALGLVTLALIALRAARGPLPVAEPRLRAAGARGRGGRAARAGARRARRGGRPRHARPRPLARARTATHARPRPRTTTATATATPRTATATAPPRPRPPPRPPRHHRHGRERRPDPLPDRARRPARRDRPAPGRRSGCSSSSPSAPASPRR